MTTQAEPSDRDRELYSRAMTNADQIARAQLGFDPAQSITLMVIRDQECVNAIAAARAEERERCIKVAQVVEAIANDDSVTAGTWRLACLQIANLIRSGQ